MLSDVLGWYKRNLYKMSRRDLEKVKVELEKIIQMVDKKLWKGVS